MAQAKIGMYLREGTIHSSSGQGDIFLMEAYGDSPIPIVPASPTPIEA